MKPQRNNRHKLSQGGKPQVAIREGSALDYPYDQSLFLWGDGVGVGEATGQFTLKRQPFLST